MIIASIAKQLNICDAPVMIKGKVAKNRKSIKKATNLLQQLEELAMSANLLYKEIIDEIGTQTLARFGLNIFDLILRCL